MRTHTNGRGFTLIELLVVIAIIGILSAVVLASLQSSRTKAADAAAKHALEGTRVQAELYYSANSNSYASVCSAGSANGVKSINSQVTSAATSEGIGSVVTAIGTAGATNAVTCHDSQAGWAAEVPQKAGGIYCVDSTGVATTSPSSLVAANDVGC